MLTDPERPTVTNDQATLARSTSANWGLGKNPTETAEVAPVDPRQIASWNFHMVGLGFLTRPGYVIQKAIENGPVEIVDVPS